MSQRNGAVAVAEPMSPGAEAVGNAIETVASHLHPRVSWNLDDHPVPTGREEVWRFTPVDAVKGLLTSGPTGIELDCELRLPAGVTAGFIEGDAVRAAAVEPPADRTSAVAAANTDRARLVQVPAGLELDEPIELNFTGTGVDGFAYGQTVIEVGAHATAQILLRYEGSAQVADKIDVRVGEGARLDLVTLQDWAPDAVHVGQSSLLVGHDATVRTVQASLGGAVTRMLERASYESSGGELEQFGLYFVDSGRHVEHRLFVDHNQPLSRSNIDYRGALQDKGSLGVWVGDVLIRKEAEGISTYEANKNLLLTEGARAESIPNLEIATGDIEGAGHSSTTGRFDDEQLFYLRSRGIPEDEARRLVVQGFFVEIVRRIGIPEVAERLIAVVERQLDAIAPDWGAQEPAS